MSICSVVPALAPIVCVACAATTPPGIELDVEATAVVVHPGFDVFTISGNYASIDEALEQARLMGQRQILVSTVIHGNESVQFPGAVVREGESASLFVGDVDDGGNGNGVQLDIAVDGSNATLHAREIADGEVIAEHDVIIPVEVTDEWPRSGASTSLGPQIGRQRGHAGVLAPRNAVHRRNLP